MGISTLFALIFLKLSPYIILFLLVFIIRYVWQYRKRLQEYKETEQATTQAMQRQVERKDRQGIEWQLKRQHQDNAWAREEISRSGLDREDTRSTKRKWVEFIVFGIIPILCLIAALNYPRYAKKRALELAQEPSNLIRGCMYYWGISKGIHNRTYFIIGNSKYHWVDISIEKAPAYQKFITYNFQKNQCYPIKYIKITNPIFAEKIFVYDIDLGADVD